MTVWKRNQKFGKNERLHSKKLIAQLFKEGKSFFKYPFKIVYLETGHADTAPVTVLISVSRKKFKRAVDRNRVKRLIREAYRKNKYILYESEKLNFQKSLLIGLIYTGKTIMSYNEIEKKIILILRHLK